MKITKEQIMIKYRIVCEYEDRYSPISKGEIEVEFLGNDMGMSDLLKTCQEIMYLDENLQDPVLTRIKSVGSKPWGKVENSS